MKSAYELAMERLQKQAPTATLSEEKKEALAEIDSQFKAKIAERELLLDGEIAKAQTTGNYAELETLQRQLASDRKRLAEDCEAKKEKVRRS